MTFKAEDTMPSVYLLKEDRRQAVLTVFNWTEAASSHTFTLADLGLPEGDAYQASDVLSQNKPVELGGGKLTVDNQPAHSVRMIKIIDSSVAAASPTITADVPSAADVGAALKFSATAKPDSVPAIAYHWDFGDGTKEDGAQVTHAYTEEAVYAVRLRVDGVDGIPAESTFSVKVSGILDWHSDLPNNRRYVEKETH
jgi:hypothetical protein